MAGEPARNLNEQEELSGPTYDRPGNEASQTPGRHLHSVPSGQDLDKSEKKAAGKTKSQAKLSVAPTGGTADSGGSTPKSAVKKRGIIRGKVNSRRNKLAVSLSVAAATVAASVAIFLALLPLKILHIVTNLEDHFFDATSSAMSNEVDSLMSSYIKNDVLPSLKSKLGIPGKTCGTSYWSTIDRNCVTQVNGQEGLVHNLYTAWAQAGMEHDLADKGIEFRFQNGKYMMKAPGLGLGDNLYNIDNFQKTPGEDLATFVSSDTQFDKYKNSTKDFKALVASKIDNVMEDESAYKKVMFKYKVGKYLEKKYGIKRCIIACGTRRDFKDWTNKKIAAQIINAQRVLQPNNDILAFVLGCIASGGSDPACKVLKSVEPENEPQMAPDGGGCVAECVAAGEATSSADDDIEGDMLKLAAKYGIKDAEDLTDAQKLFATLTGNGGYKKYIVSTVVEDLLGSFGLSDEASKAAGEFAGKLAANEIPGVGAVILLAQLNTMAVTAAKILPAMGYVMQTQTMVHEYGIYRTFADEIKEPTAPKDAAIVGSFVDSLGPGNHDTDNPDDTEYGGTAEAEQTPLYNSLIDHGNGDGSVNYVCNNGQPVPTGQLVCAESKADSKPKVSLQNTVANEPAAIQQFSQYTSDISNWFSGLASNIPGLNELAGLFVKGILSVTGAQNLLDNVGGYLASVFLPPQAIGTNNSGGRIFDTVAGGNDVAANNYTQHGLGGVVLTPAQDLVIQNQQEEQQQLQYKNQSFFAQMFDTSNDNSLVTKLAMGMPSNGVEAKSDIASFFMDPIGKLANVFGSLFSFGQVHAATVPAGDPFDISQYGYPVDDPIFTQDPEAYWNANCTTNTQTVAWDQAAADEANNNPNGMEIADNVQATTAHPSVTADPTGTNPCLLIQAAVGSAGAEFNLDLLTPDDLSPTIAPGDTTTPAAGTTPVGTVEQGTVAQLAQKLLSYQSTGQYGCAGNSGDCTDLQNMVNGVALSSEPGTACTVTALDPRVLQLLLYLIEVGNFKIDTFAMCGDHPDDSNANSAGAHSAGLAVDIDGVNGVMIGTNSAAAESNGLALDQFLDNSLPASLKLDQQISYGYGGQFDQPMAATQQAQGAICATIQDCVDFYTQTVENQHTDHIHAGYN